MRIRNVNAEDIVKIAELEKRIEGENAATKATLLARFKMFPRGFYLAGEGETVLGYVESCLWNNDDFETFDEIKDFPKYHNPEGRTLYIIFLGVAESQRRRGIGSELVWTLQRYASEKKLDKVQLVALEGFLVEFYKGLGFKIVRELPNFLSHGKGTLMEYKSIAATPHGKTKN
jgi:ribosomal protein S18 acetylase RimI-like enzyme